MPMKNVTMKPMMGVLLPTAAIASFPTNCPMMMVSMVLNTCCSMPVSARSSAKRIVFLPIVHASYLFFHIYLLPGRRRTAIGEKGNHLCVPKPLDGLLHIFLIISFLTTCLASAVPLAKTGHWLYDIEEYKCMQIPSGYRKACLNSDW